MSFFPARPAQESSALNVFAAIMHTQGTRRGIQAFVKLFHLEVQNRLNGFLARPGISAPRIRVKKQLATVASKLLLGVKHNTCAGLSKFAKHSMSLFLIILILSHRAHLTFDACQLSA